MRKKRLSYLAEEQGKVSELPENWWCKMSTVYARLESYVDVPDECV